MAMSEVAKCSLVRSIILAEKVRRSGGQSASGSSAGSQKRRYRLPMYGGTGPGLAQDVVVGVGEHDRASGRQAMRMLQALGGW